MVLVSKCVLDCVCWCWAGVPVCCRDYVSIVISVYQVGYLVFS